MFVHLFFKDACHNLAKLFSFFFGKIPLTFRHSIEFRVLLSYTLNCLGRRMPSDNCLLYTSDFIDENKVGSRSIRKDAVMCNEWIITSDSSFFKKLDNEEIKCFFETSKDFFEKKYGKENIAFASVHMDESTPHMHLGICLLYTSIIDFESS